MRSASRLGLPVVLLACLSGIGLSQCPCGPGSCGYGSCGYGAAPAAPYGPGNYGYSNYLGYLPSTSNYYQAPPAYLAGGPAYGYTYPPGWTGNNPYPPGPASYIAPPYPQPYYGYGYGYQPPSYSQSYYNPYPAYLPPARATTTPVAAPAKTAETKTPAKAAPPAPAKTAPAANTKDAAKNAKKDGGNSKEKQAKDATTPSDPQRKPLLRRLFSWW